MPIVAPALAGLSVLAIVMWAIAMALAAALLMDYIAQAFGGTPVVGPAIASGARSVAHAISFVAGKMEAGIDALIGAGWHLLARLMDGVWTQLEEQAGALAHIAGVTANHIYGISGLRGLVKSLEKRWHGIEHGIKTLTREYHGIESQVKSLEREIGGKIGAKALRRIGRLEREVGHITSDVIPGVESAEQALANDITALGKYIRANFLSTTTDAISAAVALGLAALGLGGLRCSTLTNMLGKRACGLWSDLEGLLGLFADTILLTNICELLPVLETAVSDVADPLVTTLADVGAGLCSGGIGAPPALLVPALSLPANPGFTLNLP